VLKARVTRSTTEPGSSSTSAAVKRRSR
jgi:hypothetical protein